MSRARTAVLVSGSGSNLQALLDAARDPGFPAEVALVISNVAGVRALERARSSGVETRVVDHRRFDDRESFDAELAGLIRSRDCSIVCLAGFMRILTAGFVAAWPDRVLNVHPSLLPLFPGLHTHQRVLDAGMAIAGCTVHLVSRNLDAGPIVAQAAVPVLPGDTAERLAARVLVQEHRIYPLALALLAAGRVRVENGRVLLDAPLPDPKQAVAVPDRA
ncbi:MAG: phosphoribosylglycinamide formyltransferase [Alphaproteobacteria bacterium]|nr:phosphoribosylglycinamide formyltransferase [Alphaproteobacteria bacterium]